MSYGLPRDEMHPDPRIALDGRVRDELHLVAGGESLHVAIAAREDRAVDRRSETGRLALRKGRTGLRHEVGVGVTASAPTVGHSYLVD